MKRFTVKMLFIAAFAIMFCAMPPSVNSFGSPMTDGALDTHSLDKEPVLAEVVKWLTIYKEKWGSTTTVNLVEKESKRVLILKYGSEILGYAFFLKNKLKAYEPVEGKMEDVTNATLTPKSAARIERLLTRRTP